MKKLTILLLALCFGAHLQAQKHEIVLNLEKGKEYHQNSVVKSTVSQSVMGQQMTISTTISSNLVYKVVGIGADYYDMEVRYTKMAMEMEMPMMGAMSYSSEDPEEGDLFSLIFSQMTNVPFGVRLSRIGEVLAIENMEAVFEPIMNSEMVPPAQRDEIKAQLSQSYGEEGLRSQLTSLLGVMPAQPVAIGESWDRNTRVINQMVMDVHTTYTLAEKTPAYFLIKGTSQIQSADKDIPLQTQGMNMYFDLNGTMVSEIRLDARTGWITRSTTSQEITGEAELEANEMMPEGMKIPMHILTQMEMSAQ